MPHHEDDWSDSDEEDLAEVETSVLLGVPDGPIHINSDLNDVAVSRIGGHPAFLSVSEPPFESSLCKACNHPMELLVQMWCPFEDSPMDRALYFWGCPRVGCQGKDGTVRAWRGLRYNEQYAAKLQRKRDQAKSKIPEKAQRDVKPKINPFSVRGITSSAPNPFGLGSQIFGQATEPNATLKAADDNENSKLDGALESDDDSDTESEKSLLTAMASVLVSESAWKSAPSYPPVYLSTVSEFITAPAKPKVPATAEVVDPAGKDNSWLSEAYENSLNVDQAFERFSKRLEVEPEQCVRYELKGTPLPFSSSDAAFKTLFPLPDSPTVTITKSAFTVGPEQKRAFNPDSVPACPICKSKRLFECQLTPNLINVLRPKEGANQKLSDDERHKLVEQALKKGDQDERRGMEWGTCMIFSCANDCCLEDGQKEAKGCWREEKVFIQWDT
ncbi:hypothetical protein FA15DRAFT_590061 [Coprinopsis marcescibilis]|uniref:Programmed cell death protein 2 C-terminal domain-containing protein n=1 Tax=Coprinopsis marcescibilis TaxID=230819 RepID=A0A5C3KZ10_COPMA|nr:hypothetical protein FA15DRAFT_590061 [Coprinopsis marcescibilis]